MSSPISLTELMPRLQLLLAAISIGPTKVADTEQCLDATAKVAVQLGAKCSKREEFWLVDGRGLGLLAEPKDALEVGDDPILTALTMGVTAAHPILATIVGTGEHDWRTVLTPLSVMGAKVLAREETRLPATLNGPKDLLPSVVTLAEDDLLASIAVMLCGLNARGETRLVTSTPFPMDVLTLFSAHGAVVGSTQNTDGTVETTVQGQQLLQVLDYR